MYTDVMMATVKEPAIDDGRRRSATKNQRGRPPRPGTTSSASTVSTGRASSARSMRTLATSPTRSSPSRSRALSRTAPMYASRAWSSAGRKVAFRNYDGRRSALTVLKIGAKRQRSQADSPRGAASRGGRLSRLSERRDAPLDTTRGPRVPRPRTSRGGCRLPAPRSPCLRRGACPLTSRLPWNLRRAARRSRSPLL